MLKCDLMKDNKCVCTTKCAKLIWYEQGRADKYQEITSEYMLLTEKQVAEIRVDAIEECARTIENSKTLFENHQTENVMRTKDKCITMVRNLKEQK